MKTLKALGYCVLAFAVFNTSMFTTTFIIDKGNENEQVTPETTQPSEVISTTQETQATPTDTEYSNESTQEEEVTYQTPTYTPANTEEYTVNEYIGYDNNLNGDSYSITRNSDSMKGVLTIDSQANMQWYYYDTEGIHTN